MNLENTVIILCKASEPGNVGAVCRAMKNMGLSRLRMAGCEPLNEESLLNRAIHASDIWENAQFFDTLAEAAADCSILVGTTRRRGHGRKSITMDPRTLANWLKERPNSGTIGIVFGNERTGLDKKDLDLCNIASHIPVNEAFPSLNLSHAVQIYAYELFLALSPQALSPQALSPQALSPVKGEWTPLDRANVDRLVGSISDSLKKIGFYKYPGRVMQENFLRDIICRAGLTEREGRYFRNVLIKSARMQE